MPLPRYKPSEVRLQPGAVAQSHQATAQGYDTLSAKMEQFRGMVYQEGATIRKREATQQAVVDVAKGNYKDVGDFTIYDQVYKDIGNASYTAKTEQDAKEYSAYLRTQLDANPETKNNPEAYANAFDKYTSTILNEAPNEETRAVISQSISKHGVAQYNSILEAKTKALEEYNKKSFNDGIELYKEEYRDAVLSKDVEAINTAVQKLSSFYEGGISNKYATENEAKSVMKELKEETFKEVSMMEFRESKNRISYIEKIRENNQLGYEDTQKLVDAMHKTMQSEYNDRKLIRLKREENEVNFKKNTKKSLNTKLVNGNLTENDLKSALKYGAITKSDYDDYTDRISTPGISKDDDDEYNFMLKNIDSITDEDILNANLTRTSKNSLMTKLDAYEKELEADKDELEKEAKEQGKWQSSYNGKQGIAEIKRHFKIFDGTILSKADINNDNMRDYDMMRTMLFDKIEALPLEDRIPKSLEISRQLLQEYKDGNILGTKPHQDFLDDMEEKKRTEEAERDSKIASDKEKSEQVNGSSIFSKFIKW